MKRIALAAAALLLVVLLVGAAYMGGQLLTRNTQPGTSAALPGAAADKNGHADVSRRPAPELPPASQSTGSLTYTRRVDRSVFGRWHDEGPELEVVVNQSTKVYRDTTEFPAVPPSSETVVQQTIVPGSLDEIGDGSTMIVWGARNGERIVATDLVYTMPQMLNKQ